MSQHQIDLLPDSIRDRCRAGMRTGRLIAAGVSVVVLLALAATHARLSLRSAENLFEAAKSQADVVLATEARAEQLKTSLDEAQQFISLQRKIAHPLEITAIIATIVNNLPPSMSIDRIDLDAGSKRSQRTGRSRATSADEPAPPRLLIGEIAGFAASDEEIAELVMQLQQRPLFQSVSLDFSRTRAVRDQPAREFRVSFRVNFERTYAVTTTFMAGAEAEEGATHE